MQSLYVPYSSDSYRLLWFSQVFSRVGTHHMLLQWPMITYETWGEDIPGKTRSCGRERESLSRAKFRIGITVTTSISNVHHKEAIMCITHCKQNHRVCPLVFEKGRASIVGSLHNYMLSINSPKKVPKSVRTACSLLATPPGIFTNSGCSASQIASQTSFTIPHTVDLPIRN